MVGGGTHVHTHTYMHVHIHSVMQCFQSDTFPFGLSVIQELKLILYLSLDLCPASTDTLLTSVGTSVALRLFYIVYVTYMCKSNLCN